MKTVSVNPGMTLTEIESRVLEMIKTLLGRNRTFTLEGILPKLYERLDELNISKRDLVATVYSLMNRFYIIPGFRLTRDQILTNPTRRAIYEFILRYPGAYTREIRNALGIGANEFAWHVGLLESFRFIRRRKFGNRSAFYDFYLESKYDRERFYLNNPRTRKIYKLVYELIKKKDKIEVNKVIDNLVSRGIPKKTVITHLGRLEELNVITVKNNPDIAVYVANHDKIKVMEDILREFGHIPRGK